MKYIEKIGDIENTYEGDTPEQIIDLYNLKNNSKVKFIVQKPITKEEKEMLLNEFEKTLKDELTIKIKTVNTYY